MGLDAICAVNKATETARLRNNGGLAALATLSGHGDQEVAVAAGQLITAHFT